MSVNAASSCLASLTIRIPSMLSKSKRSRNSFDNSSVNWHLGITCSRLWWDKWVFKHHCHMVTVTVCGVYTRGIVRSGRAWLCTCVILGGWGRRVTDFKASLGYVVRLCLKNNIQSTRRWKTVSVFRFLWNLYTHWHNVMKHWQSQ